MLLLSCLWQLFRQGINIILFFSFIYPVTFTFFPFLSTRHLFALIGIILLLRKLKIPRSIYDSTCLFFTLSVISLLTCVLNLTSDFSLASIPIIFLISYFSIVGVCFLTGVDDNELFTDLLTKTALLQMIISILFFVLPDVEVLLYSLIKVGELASESLLQSQGFRLHGFGTNFFSAGVSNSFILLLIAIHSGRRRIFYSVSYAIVFFVGIFIARTTFVGFLISFPILLYKTSNFSFFKCISIIGLILVIFVMIGDCLKNSNIPEIRDIYTFGFEPIINYQEEGSLNSSSVSVLSYKGKLPNDIKTWILGDGLYADPHAPVYYYKGVDQGFLRCLYYFGTVGLIVLLLGYYSIIKRAVIVNQSRLYYLLFVIYLIIMYKGHTDVFQYIIPYFILKTSRNNALLLAS